MRRLKVLIVEDNVADARLHQFALGAQSFECVIAWADTIDAALDHLQAGLEETGTPNVDVVLLDGQVGAEDASELLIVMKLDSILKEIPVVVMTGSHDTRRHQGWIAQGAEQVILKCFDVEDLESGLSVLDRYARETS